MFKKIFIILIIVVTVCGCFYILHQSDYEEELEELVEQEAVVKEEPESGLFEPASIYENDVDDSVVTMYLTVTRGNSAESTDHTWTEINSHSTYYYYDLGIERWGTEGLLQVGNEIGPEIGEFGYNEIAPNAVVKIRGQTSSLRETKSYRIEIKDGKGNWNNQKVINLNKHISDGVRFRNKLCYDLIEELPAIVGLRTQFVHLYVKDETEGADGGFVDYGLFTQVEQPNGRYLNNHGFDRYGQLYKINFFEFYRYEDVITLKNNADYDLTEFEEYLEIKGNDDHSKLIAMLDDLNDMSLPIEEVIDKWFDETNIFSWLAFNILVGNHDTEARNTMLYSPTNLNTWYLIPWDCDTAFMQHEYELKNYTEGEGWNVGISNYWGNVLFRRILTSDDYRQKLDDKINEYRQIITQEKLEEMIELYRPITYKYRNAFPDISNVSISNSDYDIVCAGIPGEVEEYYDLYLETLERPQPFFVGVPTTTEEGVRFIWDASYDFDAEDVEYDFVLDNNYGFAEPIASVKGTFDTEYTYTGQLPPGQYFMRVTARNESGYEQFAFDYYGSDYGKVYGTKSFYVDTDGSIREDIYIEGE